MIERTHIREAGFQAGSGVIATKSLRAYLELTRPANVTTALANVLAGFAVSNAAHLTSLPYLLMATACLYAGGVVLNDFFDRTVDAAERPERPIPSGRVNPVAAAGLGSALLATGVVSAFQANPESGQIAVVIAVLCLLYDTWTKHFAFAGPINMGLCRGFNLLLGIAAVPAALRENWPLALLPFTYICAVTALSRGEVAGGKRVVAILSLLSLILVVLGLFVVTAFVVRLSWLGMALTGILAWRVLPAYARAVSNSHPGVIRTAIRTGVLSLVFLDAAIGATYGGPLYALPILATAVTAYSLARFFAVT